MKSGIFPLVMFLSTCALWLTLALYCNHVRKHFLRKCPDEAQRYVTHLGFGTPDNLTFLFRKESVALLRQHADLWKLRQRAIALMVASVLWPILWMAVLGIGLALTT